MAEKILAVLALVPFGVFLLAVLAGLVQALGDDICDRSASEKEKILTGGVVATALIGTLSFAIWAFSWGVEHLWAK